MRSPAHSGHDSHGATGRAAHLDGGQEPHEAHLPRALVNTLPTALLRATPNECPPSADLPPGQETDDTHGVIAGGDLPADRILIDTHSSHVGGSPSILPADHLGSDTHAMSVGGNSHDALLAILADALSDLEGVRVATENRLRTLTAEPKNEHDKARGWSADMREVRTMQHVVDALADLEHRATLDLQRAMRAHPLGPSMKRMRGIGEKQGARLLAAIGDPATRAIPSQLWQYCGHGAPSKRQRGVKAWWNPTAKMRVHLAAESALQSGVRKLDGCDDSDHYDIDHRKAISPLGAVYLKARADWAERTDCPTCKDGICADGHKHNHALRMVAKAILLDLWREARMVAER